MNWKENKNLILLTFVAVTSLLALLANDPFLWFEKNYASSEPLLGKIQTDDIAQISVKGSAADKKFVRAGGGWIISLTGNSQTYKADDKKINELLVNLVAIKKYQLVASDETVYSEYGLTDADFAIELADSAGTVLNTIQVGKPGAGYSSTLVRLKSEKDIYATKGNLRNDWSHNLDHYRDRKLLQLSSTNIESVQINGQNPFRILKEKDKWVISVTGNSFEADSARVQALFSDLVALEGTRFESENTGGKSAGTIEIMLKGNIVKKVEFTGPFKDDEYTALSSDNTASLVIPKYKYEGLFKNPDELKKQPGAN